MCNKCLSQPNFAEHFHYCFHGCSISDLYWALNYTNHTSHNESNLYFIICRMYTEFKVSRSVGFKWSIKHGRVSLPIWEKLLFALEGKGLTLTIVTLTLQNKSPKITTKHVKKPFQLFCNFEGEMLEEIVDITQVEKFYKAFYNNTS